MDCEGIIKIANTVPDPEIPVLTLGDLGVIRGARLQGENWIIDVSPTYSGCPATSLINEMILETLARNGVKNVQIKMVLSPPWRSEWISDEGRKKLSAYGIAPPNPENSKPRCCPQCNSQAVSLLSEFGSTPCQALWKCQDCLEIFNYFKCI